MYRVGSETAAFRDRGHEVVMLGIEGDVDIKCDVRQYYPSIDDKYDMVFAHPPCVDFTLLKRKKCKERTPDMSIVWACQRIISTLNPTFWLLENPRACLRHFIGKPQVTINYGDYEHYCKKPTDLWGEFPWFFSQTPYTYIRGTHGNTAFKFVNGPRNPAQRALLPYGLSLAICKAIESTI